MESKTIDPPIGSFPLDWRKTLERTPLRFSFTLRMDGHTLVEILNRGVVIEASRPDSRSCSRQTSQRDQSKERRNHGR